MANPTVPIPVDVLSELTELLVRVQAVTETIQQMQIREWQAREREADVALAAGEYETFDDVDEAIAHLHQQV